LGSDISGKYLQENNSTSYIELKSDKTFYTEYVKEEPYTGKRMVRVTGKYSYKDKEVIITTDGVGQVRKMSLDGQKLTDVDSKTVFKKQ
jgi:hypothetical protein